MHAGACRTTTGESSAACDVSGSGVEQLTDGGVARVVSDVSVSTVRDDVTVTESADPLIIRVYLCVMLLISCRH